MTPSTPVSNRKGGRNNTNTGTKNKNTPNITSSTADWKEQINIIQDQLHDAYDTIKDMKSDIISTTENAQHALQVMNVQTKKSNNKPNKKGK